MKESMKSGDKVRLGVVRFVLSKIKNAEIDEGEQDDAGVVKLIKREVKQTREAIEQFEQGGRTDLVEAEREKLKILEEFLPEALSADELSKLIDQAIAEHGKNMGQVIGAVMQAAQNRAEGGTVAKLVRERLAA